MVKKIPMMVSLKRHFHHVCQSKSLNIRVPCQGKGLQNHNNSHNPKSNITYTFFMYTGDELKSESTLGMHCDCVYSVHDGTFTTKANSQVENTSGVIRSFTNQ